MPKRKKSCSTTAHKRRRIGVEDLPIEILYQILAPSYECAVGNIKAREVCKQWKDIVDHFVWCSDCKDLKKDVCDECKLRCCSCTLYYCKHAVPGIGPDSKCKAVICSNCVSTSEWKPCDSCDLKYHCTALDESGEYEKHDCTCNCGNELCTDCLKLCINCSLILCPGCLHIVKCQGCGEEYNYCITCTTDEAAQEHMNQRCCICNDRMCTWCVERCNECNSLACENNECIGLCEGCCNYVCNSCDAKHSCKAKKVFLHRIC